MKFVDEIDVIARSGKGGRGMVSFKADRGRPKLGADGGDGGHGGSLFIRGRKRLNTLSGLHYKHIYKAEDGVRGGSNNCTGRGGKDLILEVPLGTVAYDNETNQVIGEALIDNEKVMIAKGGKKGIGNARFLSPWHQAPEEYTPGGPSIEINLRFELKLVADVGFAGLPNAGKSTLLSTISAARPKVADYPFTTLIPYLGVVKANINHSYDDGSSFVAADIPGLIKGASDGKGLGHDFLRHIERTRVIAYVLDSSIYAEIPAAKAFEILSYELQNFDAKLSGKAGCIIISKTDMADEQEGVGPIQEALKQYNLPIHPISSLTGQGIQQLKRDLYLMVEEAKNQVAETTEIPNTTTEAKASASYQKYNEANPLPL
jgi:GTPase